MCKYNEKPLVFSLSNPTSKSEISAEQAIKWSKGKAVFAGGSPFPPVEYEGRTIIPGQGNNAFIFPGLGFGAAHMEAKNIPDELIMTAGKAVAYSVPDSYFKEGRIYPDIKDIRNVSKKVAADVAKACVDLKLTTKEAPLSYEKYIDSLMWHP